MNAKDRWKYRIIDPAHTASKRDGQGGMALKGPDSSCAPLCRVHHDEFDAGRYEFQMKYAVDMPREAELHFRAFEVLSLYDIY